MATKPRKSRRDPHREEDVPSQPTPEDVPHQREADRNKADVVLFARHNGKVFKATYAPPNMSDFLKDKPWRWSEVGSVDETVWDQLRNYIHPPGATTTGKTTGTPAPSAPSAPQPDSLQDEHVLELSKRITSAEELMDFGIKGLGLPDFKIKTAMYDHSDSIHAATHELLSTWLKKQTDRQEAYKNLLAGLKRAQMNQLASNLRIWVEGSGVISQMIDDKIADLQSKLKDFLERSFKDFLKHDWLEDGHTFPLMQYYTDLVWTRMGKEAMGRQPKSMKGLDEILKIPGAGEKCVKILISAEPGMGKSSSIAMLAMKWVKDEAGDFLFNFVFLLPLRNVDENCSLAQLLVNEHELDDADIELVDNIIRGKTSHKVLLLLDGYDEYTPGTNTELDRAIEKTIGKCFLILTSRPKEEKDFTERIREKMDGEVVIEGFSEENIKKCCSRYLGSEEAENFLETAKTNSQIYELLKVPIILLIISVLYKEDDKKSLPEGRTKLYEDLFEILMDRSTLKPNNFWCYWSDIPNLQDMLQTLGKYSWEALQNDVKQLLMSKTDLEKECPDIMKLGLLHVVGVRKATVRKQPAFLSYGHKSLQDFGASKFVTERLETSKNIEEMLKELFPSWEAVQRHKEVVIFVAGLMKDPEPLVHHVYEMQIEDYQYEMRVGRIPLIDTNLFKSLDTESTVRLFDHPLHNKYINYFSYLWDYEIWKSRYTTLFFPSRLYHFFEMREEVKLEDDQNKATEIPPCTIYIHNPGYVVKNALLATCGKIWRHQAVTDLYMEGGTIEYPTLEAPKMINPVSLILSRCNLPEHFLSSILHQLKGSEESLHLLWLDLGFMILKWLERDLDELLENLVGHHQSSKNAGLDQRRLVLRLGGGIISVNVSEEFVEKWRNRCEKVDSIDCRIGDDDVW